MCIEILSLGVINNSSIDVKWFRREQLIMTNRRLVRVQTIDIIKLECNVRANNMKYLPTIGTAAAGY